MKITTNTLVSEETFNQIVNREGSASQKMIDLFNLGVEVSEIAKILGKRYNHVYNVVTNAINTKKINAEDMEYRTRSGEGTKKQQIIDLYTSGMGKSAIAKQLGCHQQQVYQVLKNVPAPTATTTTDAPTETPTDEVQLQSAVGDGTTPPKKSNQKKVNTNK